MIAQWNACAQPFLKDSYLFVVPGFIGETPRALSGAIVGKGGLLVRLAIGVLRRGPERSEGHGSFLRLGIFC